MADNKVETTPAAAPAAGETRNIGLNVRLTPAGDSDRPVFSNFTNVNVAPGTVFVDFGFLEPGVLSALPQMVREGNKLPETINGRLSVRVAMGLDAMANLHQQLTRVINGLNAAAAEAQKKAAGN
jgi:hypothetical protein